MQAGGQVRYKRGGLGKSTSMMMIMKIIMIFMIIITTLIMMIIAISTILMKIYHGVVVHDYPLEGGLAGAKHCRQSL